MKIKFIVVFILSIFMVGNALAMDSKYNHLESLSIESLMKFRDYFINSPLLLDTHGFEKDWILFCPNKYKNYIYKMIKQPNDSNIMYSPTDRHQLLCPDIAVIIGRHKMDILDFNSKPIIGINLINKSNLDIYSKILNEIELGNLRFALDKNLEYLYITSLQNRPLKIICLNLKSILKSARIINKKQRSINNCSDLNNSFDKEAYNQSMEPIIKKLEILNNLCDLKNLSLNELELFEDDLEILKECCDNDSKILEISRILKSDRIEKMKQARKFYEWCSILAHTKYNLAFGKYEHS